jgi:hypothetical protein
LRLLSLCNIISDEKMNLAFTVADGPRQRSHSRVRVPRDSWQHFTVSDSRLPQPGRPGPYIYIPQEQDSPVIPPVSGLALSKGPNWVGVFFPLFTWGRKQIQFPECRVF